MAFVLSDRVKETSTTTGTVTYVLAGAAANFRAFSATMANNDTTLYAAVDQAGAGWEVGVGTWTTGNNLARTTILASSNAGAAVNWAAGTRDIFMTIAGETQLGILMNSASALTAGVVYSDGTKVNPATLGTVTVSSVTKNDITNTAGTLTTSAELPVVYTATAGAVTIPAAAKSLDYWIWGGGGAGGGGKSSAGTTATAGASGGGGGSYKAGTVYFGTGQNQINGGTYTPTVGAQTANGAANSNGANGNNSSLAFSAGPTITAYAGGGGLVGATAAVLGGGGAGLVGAGSGSTGGDGAGLTLSGSLTSDAIRGATAPGSSASPPLGAMANVGAPGGTSSTTTPNAGGRNWYGGAGGGAGGPTIVTSGNGAAGAAGGAIIDGQSGGSAGTAGGAGAGGAGGTPTAASGGLGGAGGGGGGGSGGANAGGAGGDGAIPGGGGGGGGDSQSSTGGVGGRGAAGLIIVRIKF